MAAYYNEHDPFAAAWLRELINAGLIAPGVVDDRSIIDVQPSDIVGFTQCHFFAGLGGWSYALRLAGWPDDRPVWTGSCPCQPFSAAGKGAGFADERHLWPAWDWLIGQCRPGVVFGEQVEAAINHGWLDLVQTDLEAKGYAFGAVGIPAAGVGAPHIRQRLWFVAEPNRIAGGQRRALNGRRDTRGDAESRTGFGRGELLGELGNPEGVGYEGRESLSEQAARGVDAGASATRGFWHPADWLPCHDEKARPVEPGTFPLAHGVSARMGRLRGYGNAIVPQVAVEVIRAYSEVRR